MIGGNVFIVYDSSDEIIVCTSETEKEVVEEWFGKNVRDIEEYDRRVVSGGAVIVVARLKLCSVAEKNKVAGLLVASPVRPTLAFEN